MSAPSKFRYVSSDRRVREDRRFVAGKGRFVADVMLPNTQHVVAVNLPGFRGSAVFGGIAVEPLPWLLLLIQKMVFDAVEHAAGEPRRRHRAARNQPHPAREDGPSPVMNGSV